MSLNLDKAKLFVNFLDVYDSHYDLSLEADPEDIAVSRLALIQAAKREMKNLKDPLAFYWYGLCHLEGIEGFWIDIEKAIFYLESAAELGDLKSKVTLADIYMGFNPNVTEDFYDFEKGCSLLENISTMVDNNSEKSYANYQLAKIYCREIYNKKNSTKALECMKIARELFSEEAECLYAYWLWAGILVEKNANEAINVLEKLIDKHVEEEFSYEYRDSLYLYGYMLYHGEGIDKNDKKAVIYLQKASELGHTLASVWLDDIQDDQSN